MNEGRPAAGGLGVPRACWLAVIVAMGCSDPTPEAPAEHAFWPLDFEQRYTLVRDCRLSPAEHDGYYIQVFADPTASDAYLAGDYPFLAETELVKGEYEDDACSVLRRVSGMRKLDAGAAPELGDWQWQRANPSGQLLLETAARSCAGCHEACESRDYACTDP